MRSPASLLRHLALTFVLALSLNGCDAVEGIFGSDDDGGGTHPPTSAALARFNVELRASGAFRPGQPVQLTMSVRALLPTSDARVDLVLPELAEAELRGGWDNYEPVRGQPLRPLASRRQALGRGAVTQHQASVTFPRPGYYSVWATVTSADSAAEDGQPVQNTEARVLYLWISETGGRVMDQFDPTLLPDSVLPGLGPLRPRRAPPAPQAAGSRSVQAQTGSIQVLVDYLHPEQNIYVPVPNADYRVSVYDYNGALLRTLPPGRTNASGNIIIPCATGDYRFVVNVWARNQYVTVGTPADFRTGKQIVAATYYYTSCGGPVFPGTPADISRVFTNMTVTAANAGSFFGVARPLLPVALVYDATYPYSAYCPYLHAACSAGGVDYVKVNTYTGSTYAGQVWGKNGIWTQAHEYGHAFHEKALGGYVEQFWKTAGCPTNHPIDTPTKLRCAYPEGFATYFAVATRGDSTGYEYGIEINYYCLHSASGGADGSIVEGAVASFFYDITDGNRFGTTASDGYLNEAHDAVRYPGRLVADMITHCQVLESGTWRRATGIDHIVYCLEKKVDPAVTGSPLYFPSRGTDPTQQTASTSQVWDAAQIRKLWLWNLYERTAL